MGHNSGDPTDRRLEEAKEIVISGRDSAHQPVREPISTSWRRSSFWGVSSDSLDPPYSPQRDDGGRLVSAAKEVLDHLVEALAGTAMSVILTDAHGNVLERRTAESSLARHLDSIHLAPGFSYAEQHVGTNGIGSAIESRKPFFVAGAEHFVHPLASVSCAGAPIVHPLTGRIEGVIDLTCRAGDATPLMMSLASEAAAEIVQRLVEQATSRQRALLFAFLAADRRSSRPVIAIDSELWIANSAAAALLERADHASISDKAAEVLGRGKERGEMVLSGGQNAALAVRRVEGSASGVVVELNVVNETSERLSPRRSGQRPQAPGLVGHNGAWIAAWDKAVAACGRNERLLLVGEPGSGKLATLIGANSLARSADPMTVLDMADLAGGASFAGGASLANLAREAPSLADRLALASSGQPGTLVLRRMDALGANERQALREWIEAAPRDGGVWITGTLRSGAGSQGVAEDLSSCFDAVVEIPALRYRIDDIRELVAHLLARLAPARQVEVAPDAIGVLARHPWVGNIAELEDALRVALSRRPRGLITASELPEWSYSTSRQALSQWETMERDLITRALMDEGGDKARAATRLGISRATIYRKIRSYGIVIPDQPRTT